MSAGLPAKEQESKLIPPPRKHKGVNSALHLAYTAARFELLRAYKEGWSEGSTRDPQRMNAKQLKALNSQALEYVDSRMGRAL